MGLSIWSSRTCLKLVCYGVWFAALCRCGFEFVELILEVKLVPCSELAGSAWEFVGLCSIVPKELLLAFLYGVGLRASMVVLFVGRCVFSWKGVRRAGSSFVEACDRFDREATPSEPNQQPPPPSNSAGQETVIGTVVVEGGLRDTDAVKGGDQAAAGGVGTGGGGSKLNLMVLPLTRTLLQEFSIEVLECCYFACLDSCGATVNSEEANQGFLKAKMTLLRTQRRGTGGFREHLQTLQDKCKKTKEMWSLPLRPHGFWTFERHNFQLVWGAPISNVTGRRDPYDELLDPTYMKY
ncbi:hypothetical protein Drorol1_Dr00025905 [Drosera rotundifolia]